jgi:hypothetical protein
MPAFKQKSSKKLLTDVKNSVTLDNMHREKQAEFHYIETELIPKLEKELADNRTFLKEHSSAARSKASRTESLLDEVYRIRDRNLEIKDALQQYKNYIKNYYLTNNKYIFSYFEDKKDISDTAKDDTTSSANNANTDISISANANANTNDATTLRTKPARAASSSGKINDGQNKIAFTKNERIQSFFKVNSSARTTQPSTPSQPQTTTTTTETQPPEQPSQADSNTIAAELNDHSFSFEEQNVYVPKLTNLQHYLHNTGKAFFDYEKYAYRADVCAWCSNGEMVAIESEGILVCNKCSNFTVYYVETDKPSYKEPPKEASFYAYRRINHFREILAQVQAKETTQIDHAIITAIENQLRKERISLDQFTDTKAKEVLKKLGYNKYYEHIPFIKEKLGIKPPVMSPELEETLCNLFMETQGPYARFCPDERVNFLNYYYTIYKLCELLGQTQYLPYFPMLKDRDKRIEQDEIWKKICKELNWDFIPTQ